MSDRRSGLRIIVLGYIVRGPLGGLVWHHLQYVMGLARLGHDVYFLEDSGDYPACYDPSTHTIGVDPTYGLRFAQNAFDSVDLGARWAYYDAHTKQWMGPRAEKVPDLCATADILINLSGVNPLRPWLLTVPVRALVDTDPAFTQIRHLMDSEARQLAAKHTAFFSFGENIGTDLSKIPEDGFDWRPTRQPVVLAAWPVTPGPVQGAFTTVMQWDSYPPRSYDGQEYGMKSESFRPYIDLPAHIDASMELALGSPSAPREELLQNGWRLRDPLEVTRDPWTYQAYLQQSKAEFSVAKHGYVAAQSGWFSERSAAYLASGRPVVVQDTGFTDWLDVGRGVHAFSSPEEAIAAIDCINGDYSAQCRGAREMADAYFDANKILPALLEQAMSNEP